MLHAVLFSCIGALFAPFICRVLPRYAGWLCAMPPLALFCWFALQIGTIADGGLLHESVSWIPSFNLFLTFRLDGLGLLFALLITAIGALVVLYATSYLHGHRYLGRFYGLILAFMAAMLGTVLAGDLITLFVFWELTGICSFLLIGFDHERLESRRAALQALLVTGAGGLALLAGIVLMGQVVGSMELQAILSGGELIRGHSLYLPILALVLLGAFTKSAQFPFHFWLPGAMAAPTPVSAYLHSATMVKLGIFLLARFFPVLGGTDAWFFTLVIIGGITLLLGGCIAILRNDLKQILAWSTVSALGMLTLLLGIGSPAALVAAMVLLPVHALYKSSLFLVAGAVDHAVGSRDISRLGGLGRVMPWVTVAAGLAALSMAGLPPLVGFIAKELFYEATLAAPLSGYLLTAIALLGNGLAVTIALLTAAMPFYGRINDPSLHPHAVPPGLWLPPLIPAVMGLLCGLLPGLFGFWLVAPATAAVQGSRVAVDLALWHGFNPVLLLSLATLLTGLALVAFRKRLLSLKATLTGTRWLYGPERLYDLLIDHGTSAAVAATALLQSGRLRYYLMTVIGVAVALMGGILLANQSMPEIATPEGALHEWLTGVVILAGAVFAAITTSRLAAVAALGTVGYGVALIYILFGAPDLAMTQFCIETLSIILFVLVLHRLPHFTLLSSPAVRLRDLLIALGIGGIMTMLAWLAISQPLVPHISDWFIEKSLPLGHGRNVVNVILVDFRALDTLGEITVLGVAALGVYGLLKSDTREGR